MTSIEWTEQTWNPTTGCDRISPGCDNCYALTMAKRLKGMGSAKYQTDGDPKTSGPGFGVAMHEAALVEPLRWSKPRRVFVNSMSDLFHAKVTDEFIAKVFAVMALTPQHTYQILSKRHGRMRSLIGGPHKVDTERGYTPGVWFRSLVQQATRELGSEVSLFASDGRWPLPNVWLGVSVEDQKRADLRILSLAQTPAAVRFLSCEPLLGPIKLHRGHVHCPVHDFPGGFCSGPCPYAVLPDWVIVGGESGAGARPLNTEWVAGLIDDSRAAGAAPFVKQLGSVWARANGASDGKGGKPADWPAELRVREYPAVIAPAAA